MFPEDGHPDTASFVQNFTSDPRDEIMVWDMDRIWIYTQSEEFKGEQIYAPTRSPLYYESNYLSFVSWPPWKPHRQ